MDTQLIEKLKAEIESFSSEAALEQVGRVSYVSDGVAEIGGLIGAKMNEMVVFDDGNGKSLEEALEKSDPVFGVLLNLEKDLVKAMVLGDTTRITEGMLVRSTGKILSLPLSDEVVGRVIDPLGKPLDGKGGYEEAKEYPIEREAYGVIDRKSVDTPLHTGIKAIDTMIPIGRGQRELIIGDRFTGKTTLAIDTILNQLNEPKEKRPICIYVAIGQKESKVAKIEAMLREKGAMEYTVIITASSAMPAALQYLAPFSGAAVGEYFMDQGKDALVVYDDLSKHAVAYRQISLLLRRPPGREAYPGDIFYLHSRLLERAAKLRDERGGGSLTALPIIETKEGDVSAYIPTNVISITDGQIYLDTESFNKGDLPAVNVGLSVSRVGSSAQTKAMKKVAGTIRIELAQFRELEAFMQFSQDLDAETKKRIESGRRLTEVLKQGKNMPMAFERQVPVIYTAIHGMLDHIDVSDVLEVEEKFLDLIEREKPELFTKLSEEKAITEEIETMLNEVVRLFRETHANMFNGSEAAQEDELSGD